MESSELIRVEGLRVQRGRFVLDVPSWQLVAGQVVGLVGPNGAGKTTLLQTVAGLIKAAEGQVGVFGLDPWRNPVDVRSRLGFMSDDMPLFDLRVGPLLRQLSGYYPSWNPQLVQALLERFDLDVGDKVTSLSRGQGTRLRLITALAFEPRVLLLDEPAAGLDLGGRRALLRSVLEVVRDPGRSVVISSHLLADVERIADRLLVLEKGRVVREGGTDDLVGDDRTLEEALVQWGAAG